MTSTHDIANRSSKLIYRDLIKIVKTVMSENKRIPVISMIRREFEKNKTIKDESELLELKINSAKSITNLYINYVKNALNKETKTIDKNNLL